MKSLDELLADIVPVAEVETSERSAPLAWSDVTVGRTEDGLTRWRVPRCPACRGVERVEEARCSCAGLAARAARLTWARIPWAYRDTALPSGGPAEAWVTAWVAGSPGWRLVGPPGTGKTWRLVGLARALAERRVRARYELWSEWCRRHREAIGRPEHDGMRDALVRCDVLCLDDMGRERSTDYVRDTLDDVVGARLDRGLTVVCASNLDDAGLAEYLGARLWSRLRGATAAVVMGGEDRRGRLTGGAA